MLWFESPTGVGHCKSAVGQALVCAKDGYEVVIATSSVKKMKFFSQSMGFNREDNFLEGNGSKKDICTNVGEKGGSIKIVFLKPMEGKPDNSSSEVKYERGETLLKIYNTLKPKFIITDMVPFDTLERGVFEYEINELLSKASKETKVYAISRDIIIQEEGGKKI